jgi:hypothetical protein
LLTTTATSWRRLGRWESGGGGYQRRCPEVEDNDGAPSADRSSNGRGCSTTRSSGGAPGRRRGLRGAARSGGGDELLHGPSKARRPDPPSGGACVRGERRRACASAERVRAGLDHGFYREGKGGESGGRGLMATAPAASIRIQGSP